MTPKKRLYLVIGEAARVGDVVPVGSDARTIIAFEAEEIADGRIALLDDGSSLVIYDDFRMSVFRAPRRSEVTAARRAARDRALRREIADAARAAGVPEAEIFDPPV